MKTIYVIFALSTANLLVSCGDSKTSDKKEKAEVNTEEKADPNVLASSFCECMTTSVNSDSCGQLSLNYALKLAIDKEALSIYNQKTEACIDAKLEADMEKAMKGLDEMEKQAIAE